MRILVVEDSDRLAQSVKKGLNDACYAVDLAADGETGFQKAQTGEYDLVLLDINLPKLDGISLMRSLRAMHLDVPIIVVTAKDDVQSRIEGLDNGANDYVVKPFSFNELLARIRAAIRAQSLQVRALLGHGTIDLEEAFAKHLHRLGIATYDQIERARGFKRSQAEKGLALTLDDALVETGAITESIKLNILGQLNSKVPKGLNRLGSYLLLKKLGEGAMGTVHMGRDVLLQRNVAVKVLKPHLAEHPQYLSRFRREAKAAGHLNHANICGAYAVGEERGIHFYVMEYCEGESLAAKLERQKVLSCREAVEIVAQAARGLQFAHDHGILHRDIKPDNLFETHDGVLKILDLGLSKRLRSDNRPASLTMSGMAVGTPNYLSPEQARGERNIDGRSDIYALGATFFHLVTGQPPFNGPTAASILIKHLRDPTPNPRAINANVTDDVVRVVSHMMAKDPADRYADCKALLQDLETLRCVRTGANRLNA